MNLGQILAMPGRDGPDTDPRFLAARAILAVHIAARCWQFAVLGSPFFGSISALVATAAAAICLAGFRPGATDRGHRAIQLSAAVVALQILGTFPLVANHVFLELYCAAAFALFDPKRDRVVVLEGLRWMALLVFFWGGVQKALYGTWFSAELLAIGIVQKESFARFFVFLADPEEVARLTAYGPPSPGDGPYRLSGPIAWVGNLVWMAEIGLPLLLLHDRTRIVGALGMLGLLVAIQLGALEFFFGGLYASLLLLFLPGAWNRRLLWPFVGFYLLLTASVVGLLPSWGFN